MSLAAGKTTIGKLIAGFYKPSGGRIMLFGKPQNPKQLQKQVLFILQEAEFQFFTSSVLHELQYGHAVTPEFEAKTEALLKSMDMWDCRDRHPFSLSGGQMQRLTLMMAYLSDKPIVRPASKAALSPGGIVLYAVFSPEHRKDESAPYIAVPLADLVPNEREILLLHVHPTARCSSRRHLQSVQGRG